MDGRNTSEADRLLTMSIENVNRAAAAMAENAPTDLAAAIKVAKAYTLLREAREINARPSQFASA